MTAAPIVCWGELLWDLFPDGRRLGGTAANVAYHLAQLGRAVVLVSRVGNDEPGRAALVELERSGVDVSQVQVDPDSPTGTVGVELSAGEPRFTLASGAAWDRIEYPEELSPLVRRTPALYYGTLAQRTPLGSTSLMKALAETAPGCWRVCDLNVRPPFATQAVVDAALSRARAVKLNESEAALVADRYATTDPVAWLVERGVELVAATRGERGALVATRGTRAEHSGYPVDPSRGDRVGAGDAFTAMLIHQLLEGATPARIAERANRYAAHVASQPGAMPAIPEELARP
jgi:fructokinase